MRILTIVTIVAVITALAAGVKAESSTIEQSGQRFSEKTVALEKGDTLTFANHDDVTHNINLIGEDDEVKDLGLQKPGMNLAYKFDKSGRFKVRCSIHPGMKMTASVK